MKRTIPQGQYIAPIHAAESYVGRRYSITGTDPDDEEGTYSANPADYWYASDADPVGRIIGPIADRTVTGYPVTRIRVLKEHGTMGNLRRLARAAASLVRP